MNKHYALFLFPLKQKELYFNEDLRLEMCLQDISTGTRKEFLQRTIENLLSSNELMHTLHLFIDYNQSYKQTAEKLHIHINTLHYRLKKSRNIQDLTLNNLKI